MFSSECFGAVGSGDNAGVNVSALWQMWGKLGEEVSSPYRHKP